MSSSHWEEFYANHLPPADFEDNRSLLKEFCARHNEDQNSIVLVTVCMTVTSVEHLLKFINDERLISAISTLD